MKWFSAALIYVGFFGLIGVSVYATNSGWPLLALLLAPSIDFSEKKEQEKPKGANHE